MASTQINYTQGTPTNAIKYTLSMWVKRSNTFAGDSNYLASVWVDGNNHWCMRFNDDQLDIYDYISSSTTTQLKTSRKFRDPTAWYHIVYVYDSANSTAGDRQKIYVNGVEETSFATDTNPGSSAASVLNVSGRVLTLGARNSASYFDGSMSWVQFVDGAALAPTEFGEVDSTSGIWKIKTTPYATPGNNGFCLKMEDRSNLDLDSSSNAFTFTTTGTGTATYDNPSNNFCTMNPLRPNSISQTYSNGNNTFIRTGTGGQMNGTLGITKGKWYYECLIDDYWQYIGWTVPSLNTSQTAACSDSGSGFYGVYANATNMSSYANGVNSALTGYTVMAAAQYISIAFDADNGELYYGTNGVWGNSSNPVTRTNPFLTSVPVTDFVVPAIGQGTGSRSSTIKMNFGNGYFGTTSSGTTEADDAGIGQFKYDVPAGFHTLCTKNIKAYG